MCRKQCLRDTYHPLFDQYGVDLVLQGHVHNYQRTYPLKYNPSSHSSPIKTSSSTSSYTDPQGEIFATVGTGGINFHGLSGKSSFVVYQQDSSFGYLDIAITNDGSTLTGKYYTNGGSVKDQFSISKSSSNTAPTANSQSVTVNKDTPTTITLTASDPNGDALTYTKLTDPLHGTLTGTVPSLTYTPSTGYTGPDSSTFKANDGTSDSNSATVSINVVEAGGGYHYDPSLSLSGSNFYDVASTSALQLSKFSLAAWFKTSSDFGGDAFIVNKGGFGGESPGLDMNYGLYMTSSEVVRAGFEQFRYGYKLLHIIP